jgi:hypothetical protein
MSPLDGLRTPTHAWAPLDTAAGTPPVPLTPGPSARFCSGYDSAMVTSPVRSQVRPQ